MDIENKLRELTVAGGGRVGVCWNRILEILLMIHCIASTFFFLGLHIDSVWLKQAETEIMRNSKLLSLWHLH